MVAMEMGNPFSWCISLFLFIKTCCFNFTTLLISFFLSFFFFFFLVVAMLENPAQGRIKTAPDFFLIVDDFDKLVDPNRLYERCLGPEPSVYVLKKIALEGKSRFLILHLFLSYLIHFHPANLLLAEMATRYNKDKYARVKSLKNEPLSLITLGSKKHRLDEGKDETPTLQSLFGTPSSPTPSLKMMTFSPSTTRFQGMAKVGKSVWDDPATALGKAHNAVTDDKLKGLLSIPSHELVNCHIHKLVQIFYSTFLHYSLSSYTC